MENSFTIIYPDGKTEKKIEGKSIESNALVKKRYTSIKPQTSLKHIIGAFVHAMSWRQLKQVSYPALLQNMRKRWYLGAGAAAVLCFFLFTNIEEKERHILVENQGQMQKASILAVDQFRANSAKPKKVTNNALLIAAEPNKAKKLDEAEEFRLPLIPEASRKENALLKELGRHAQAVRDNYINRYAKVAEMEQNEFGIPASITLGLAVLQSDFGTKLVAKKANNHLMISCEINPIPMGKGMTGQGVHAGICYTRYESVWMSFRAHSEVIKRNYNAIQDHAGMDYRKWAKALESAGYFQKGYNAKALIQTIKAYNLQKFDSQA